MTKNFFRKLIRRFKILFKEPHQLMLVGVYAVMLSYPATMFIYKGIRSEYLAVLFLMAVYGFLTRKIQIRDYPLTKIEFITLALFASISIIAWVSYAYFGFLEEAVPRVEKYSWFILALPVYYLFRYVNPRMDVIFFGIVLGCFIAFGRAVLESFGMVKELAWEASTDRANGVMHPIRFGDLTLLLGFFSLAGGMYLKDGDKRFLLIGSLGFVAGIGASLLSLSRGAWVAIPVLLVALIFPVFSEIRIKHAILFLLSLILVVGVLYNIPQLKIEIRVKQAEIDLVKYFSGNGSNTSIGSRLDMYKTAYSVFKKNPLFGGGVGEYHKYALNYYKSQNGKISKEVIIWKNPHNEFLLQAATRGMVGVISISGLFLVTFLSFYLKRSSSRGAIRFSAISGMILVLGYAQFGMSVSLFEHRDFLLFFLIYVFIFLAGTSCAKSPEIEHRI